MNALHWFWSRSNLKERGQEIRQFDENIAPRAGRDCLWPTDDQGHMQAPVGHRHLPPLILVQFYGGRSCTGGLSKDFGFPKTHCSQLRCIAWLGGYFCLGVDVLI